MVVVSALAGVDRLDVDYVAERGFWAAVARPRTCSAGIRQEAPWRFFLYTLVKQQKPDARLQSSRSHELTDALQDMCARVQLCGELSDSHHGRDSLDRRIAVERGVNATYKPAVLIGVLVDSRRMHRDRCRVHSRRSTVRPELLTVCGTSWHRYSRLVKIRSWAASSRRPPRESLPRSVAAVQTFSGHHRRCP